MAKASLAQKVSDAWYQDAWWLILLRPLSYLFRLLTSLRRRRLGAGRHGVVPSSTQANHFTQGGSELSVQSGSGQGAADTETDTQTETLAPSKQPVVIVVGNIAVGGTGKTPLIIAMAKRLRAEGLRVGVVSRGYGSQAPHYPYAVPHDGNAQACGDEPLLIRLHTDRPVVIDADRSAALKHLLSLQDCDVVLSDDGLQHYRLLRHIEIALLDGSRGIGNGQCLPAGPLREMPNRLTSCEHVVINRGLFEGSSKEASSQKVNEHPSVPALMAAAGERGHNMFIAPSALMSIYDASELEFNAQDQSSLTVAGFPLGQPCLAMAGIANPQKFFTMLESLGLEVQGHSFDDHQDFSEADLAFAFNKPLLMTSKDAVKCASYLRDKRAKYWWCIDIDATLDENFWQGVLQGIAQQQAQQPAE